MGLYSAPPPARPFTDIKPTLLTSWWITLLCAVIIVLRLLGRCIRVERLFREDVYAAAALIPLFLRMAFVHPVLLFGTNNVLVDNAFPLTDDELQQRSIGSRLVLVSRILHPAVLWLLKLVTLEFFDRLVGLSGSARYAFLLRFTRAVLAITFLAVLVADLAECRPSFSGYWQVIPDPGGQCRQGYAYLITLTVGNVLTDLLLVVFPVPIVVRSRLKLGRKVLLAALFCLHLLTVAVALYKVPRIMSDSGDQTTRTMWASAEILTATFAANALTIGTFVRDTGLKKKKNRYRYQPDEAETRGVMSGSKVTKGSWLEADSEGEDGVGHGARNAGAGKGTQVDGNSGVHLTVNDGRGGMARTESLDSLIPRPRVDASTPDVGGGVVKTTTVEVRVSVAGRLGNGRSKGNADGLLLRPADGVVTASVRGKGRGSSVPLKQLSQMPG